MQIKRRVAVIMYDQIFWPYGATYPFGELIVEVKGLTVRVPFFKTAFIPKEAVRQLEVFNGLPGLLKWLVMPGIKIQHTSDGQPKVIKVRTPNLNDLCEVLKEVGYDCAR
jgi:hypothetical protein